MLQRVLLAALVLLPPPLDARLGLQLVPPVRDLQLRLCHAEPQEPAALRNATLCSLVLLGVSTGDADDGTADCLVQPSVRDASLSCSRCVRPPEAWRPPGWAAAVLERALRAVGSCASTRITTADACAAERAAVGANASTAAAATVAAVACADGRAAAMGAVVSGGALRAVGGDVATDSKMIADSGAAERATVVADARDAAAAGSCCAHPPEAWTAPGWAAAASERALRAVGGCVLLHAAACCCMLLLAAWQSRVRDPSWIRHGLE